MTKREARRVSRRQWLATTAVAGGAAAAWGAASRLGAAEPATAERGGDGKVAFFFVSDTHYLADKERPDQIDPRSAAVTGRLVDLLNRLPGETIPEAAGGGRVSEPRGVLHGGDLIDSGDKGGELHAQMQKTEWAAYCADFDAAGEKGRLKYPVYEVHGNHDSPRSEGLAIDGIVERNRRRPGVSKTSPNGLHYSWDWGPVHFVNLGIVVGQDPRVKQRRRYAPRESLDFLVADLAESLGDARRPVVITHHIDVARYTGPCDPEDPANLSKEWNPCDVRAYYEAIKGRLVAGIFYGHTHARNVARWDGESAKGQTGLPLFNVDNSAHFSGGPQAFFYVEITPERLVVRECFTKDAWQSHDWTPQVWTQDLSGA